MSDKLFAPPVSAPPKMALMSPVTTDTSTVNASVTNMGRGVVLFMACFTPRFSCARSNPICKTSFSPGHGAPLFRTHYILSKDGMQGKQGSARADARGGGSLIRA